MCPYVGGSLTSFFGAEAQAATSDCARKMTDAGGDHVLLVTRMNTPVETGELRAAWHREATTPFVAGDDPAWRTVVRNDKDYAADVEYGTGLWGPSHAPYVIKPRSPGGTLRFVARDGKVVFAKQVIHPGSPGNFMLAIGMNVTYAAMEGQQLFRVQLEQWVRAMEAAAR